MPRLQAGCIVSDVGSVKGEIVRDMERLPEAGIHFVGRPSDRGQRAVGAEAARENLSWGGFVSDADAKNQSRGGEKDGVLWVVSEPTWKSLMPKRHDHILGVVSHLPHMASFARSMPWIRRNWMESIETFALAF